MVVGRYRMKIRILFILFVFASVSSICASDPLSKEDIYLYRDFGSLGWQATNTNATALLKLDDLSLISTGYYHANGDYHRFENPEQTSIYELFTEGFKRLGKTSMNGMFSYQNGHYNKLQYNHMSFPVLETPFKIGDTDGGDYAQEDMKLKGVLSHSMSQKIQLGIQVDYSVGMGAKQKNVRNQNKITNLGIAPGISFIGNNGTHAVDLRLQRRTENINASSYANNDANKNYVYEFVGMGLTKGSPLILDSYAAGFYNNGIGGKYSYLKHAEMENLFELGFYMEEGEVRKGTYELLVFGTTSLYEVQLKDVFEFKSHHLLKHRFAVNARFSMLKGVQYDQIIRHKTDINGNDSSYVETLGKPEPKYSETRGTLNLNYRCTKYKSNASPLHALGTRLEMLYLDEKRTPVTSHTPRQTIANAGFNLFAQKFFDVQNIACSIMAEGKYRYSIYKDLYYEHQVGLLDTYLQHNFDYLSSDLIAANLTLKSNMTLFKFPVYINMSGGYWYPLNGLEGTDYYNFITTLGILF